MNKNIKIEIAVGIILAVSLLLGGFFWLQDREMNSSTAPIKMEAANNQKGDLTKNEGSQNEKDTLASSKKIFYIKGSDLISYDAGTKEKMAVLHSDRLIDFDISADEKFLTYTLREDGFEGNSDIYLENLTTGEITRLTENNNITSSSPKIFPDNSQVAYVRRTLNATTHKLSDGEIWVINAKGDINSSKKLFGDDTKQFIGEKDLDKVLDDSGKWTGEYFCINQEEIDSVKIGISEISPDGKNIAYWKSNWAPECSGLWRQPEYATIGGLPYFTSKFNEQNKFEYKYDNKIGAHNWLVGKTFWFNDGSIAVANWGAPPINGDSAYYYDKDQNKKWKMYDSTEQTPAGNFSQFNLLAIKKISEDKVVVAYHLYSNAYDKRNIKEGDFTGYRYFVKTFSIGEDISSDKLAMGESFASITQDDQSFITNVNIVGNNLVRYQKEEANKHKALYLYDAVTKKEVKVDDLN